MLSKMFIHAGTGIKFDEDATPEEIRKVTRKAGYDPMKPFKKKLKPKPHKPYKPVELPPELKKQVFDGNRVKSRRTIDNPEYLSLIHI